MTVQNLFGLSALTGGVAGGLAIGIVFFAVVLSLLSALAIATPLGTAFGYVTCHYVERRWGYDGLMIWIMALYSVCIAIAAVFIGISVIGALSAVASPLAIWLYVRYRSEALSWGMIALGGLIYLGSVIFTWLVSIGLVG
ncbi:hypothetical protein KC571_02205 [candidate division WWE3 bacterium]|uniref:Uncharacterized protein n=1 Tax=candidate division WWE3 bacterium TaxID=2053526 RepID=A0A955RQ90_UNCKA|nr:hypothetical protein [candidate division WWE3 bacterium]